MKTTKFHQVHPGQLFTIANGHNKGRVFLKSLDELKVKESENNSYLSIPRSRFGNCIEAGTGVLVPVIEMEDCILVEDVSYSEGYP